MKENSSFGGTNLNLGKNAPNLCGFGSATVGCCLKKANSYTWDNATTLFEAALETAINRQRKDALVNRFPSFNLIKQSRFGGGNCYDIFT